MQQQLALFSPQTAAAPGVTKIPTEAPTPKMSDLDITISKKFRHLSNAALVKRINGLPDFKWDDEGYELQRRIKASNGKFAAQMQGNNIVILKDEN